MIVKYLHGSFTRSSRQGSTAGHIREYRIGDGPDGHRDSAEGKIRRAPIDTGRLRKGTSAKAFTPKELGQPGHHRVYAGFRRVSGRSTFYGRFHDPKSRFLSDPFEAEADRLPERLDREFTKRAARLPDIKLN